MKLKKEGVGKAHSKIILMGEHAVVYGYPALALPLKGIEVTCQILPGQKELERDKQDPLVTAIHAALDHLAVTDRQLTYTISSQVPERRGMGSSAAVSLAAIRAVFDYCGQALADQLLEELVNQAERVAHTNPSGLDAKTCLSDSPLVYTRTEGFRPVKLDLSAYLVIADTGLHGQTSEAVQKVKNQGNQAQPYLEQLGHLTDQALVVISRQDLTSLGQVMTQAHGLLDGLGVSCPEANALVAAALEAGALGAKMTGGGLGGCIIALTPSREAAERISQHLAEKGARETWIESL